MSTVATRPVSNSAFPPRKWWTRGEYQSMISLGVLEDGGPFELIEGEVVEKAERSRKRVAAWSRAYCVTSHIFDDRRVQPHAPVALDDFNELEPDVAVLRHPADSYMADAPGPDDLLLVIETSATPLPTNPYARAAIYARAGITDYWVMDVNRRLLYQYRSPGPDVYASIVTFMESDTISPLAAPEQSIPVADLLPPQEA